MRSIPSIPRLIIVVVGSVCQLAMLAGCLRPHDVGRRHRECAEPSTEFRGIFVATAFNQDWPSRPGLHWHVLNDEIRAIVFRAKELKCNAIILQARALGDRIHRKPLSPDWDPASEPWGAALVPGDPKDRDPDKKDRKYNALKQWIDECHANNIELYLWVNPFRVDGRVFDKPPSDRTRKELPLIAKKDYSALYLDYTQTDVQKHVLGVIDDLLRYKKGSPGISGILFDHNMPPPYRKARVSPLAMASAATKPAHSAHEARVKWLAKKWEEPPHPAGPETMDGFISAVFNKVHTKHGLKFGVSPDWDDSAAMAWVEKGMVDYVVPEFYEEDVGQQFDKKLQVWLQKIKPQRGFTPMVLAGLNTIQVQTPPRGSNNRWSPDIIAAQICRTRDVALPDGRRASGHVHFSWSALRSPVHAGPDTMGHGGTLDQQLRGLYTKNVPIPDRATRPPR